MSKPFDFVIPFDSIDKSQQELIVKAHDAAVNALKKNINNIGSIFCQLWLEHEGSEVHILGTFIPNKYATRILMLIEEAANAKKP